ncbi:hypothetical protein [Pseudarthrobacter albicanus]|nr:hypothetical protein [Pseudarthrobacter albicanus]
MDTTTIYLKFRPESIRQGFDQLPAITLPERSGSRQLPAAA